MTSVHRVGLGALFAAGLLALPLQAAEKKDIDKAVENGVAYLKSIQEADGTWRYNGKEIGATALACLALLECDVPTDDPAILKAVKVVREACIELDSTYSLSLCILFLDRLGDPDDVPLIESMTLRLMAGQNSAGGWSYKCPLPAAGELVRLKTVVNQKGDRKPSAKGEVSKGEASDDKPSRDSKDKKEPPKPSKEIQAQIDAINRGGGKFTPGLAPGAGSGDHSNTQFAILALWVGRRHGMPVDNALARVDARFRQSQNPDGGWSYILHSDGAPGGMAGSSPAMTCAGLLGLAAGQGAAMTPVLKSGGAKKEKEKEKDQETSGQGSGKKEPATRDLSKDVHVKAALKALGKWVGGPIAKPAPPVGPGPFGNAPALVDNKMYYTFWSLERVAVAYSLDTIGNKDWYDWGSDILVAEQQRDGSWRGGYSAGGVDTDFALLFLRRANLARDLTTVLKGRVTDPDRVVLKAGPNTDNEAKPDVKEEAKPKPTPPDPTPAERKPADVTKEKPDPIKATPAIAAENDASHIAQELIQATSAKQERLLDNLRENKGAEYTQALLKAIPKLDGDIKKKARDALAERMSRMTSATLRDRLKDDDAEMRRASALAVAMKEDTAHVPRLIELLDDPNNHVSRAAYAALKSLSGKDFGPAKDASRAERTEATAAWKAWWKDKAGK